MNADRCSDVRSDPCVVLRSLSCFGIRPGAQRLVWKRMRSGDRPGLQNRRAAGFPVAGGFDPHSLPPFVFSLSVTAVSLKENAVRENIWMRTFGTLVFGMILGAAALLSGV